MIVREKPVDGDPAAFAGVPLGALGGGGGSSERTPVAPALAGGLVAREGSAASVANSVAGSHRAVLERAGGLTPCPGCAPLPCVSVTTEMPQVGDVVALIGGGATAVAALGAASASAPVGPPGPFGVVLDGADAVAREGSATGAADASDRVTPPVGPSSSVPASPSSVAGAPASVGGWPSAEPTVLVSETTCFTASAPLGRTCVTLGASFVIPCNASPPCCTTCVALGASFATPLTTACGSRVAGVLAAPAVGTLRTGCPPDTAPVAASTAPPAGFTAAEASEVAALVAAVVVASAAGTTPVAAVVGTATGAAVPGEGATGEVDGATGEGTCAACVTVLSVDSIGPAAIAGVAQSARHSSAANVVLAAPPIRVLERWLGLRCICRPCF